MAPALKATTLAACIPRVYDMVAVVQVHCGMADVAAAEVVSLPVSRNVQQGRRPLRPSLSSAGGCSVLFFVHFVLFLSCVLCVCAGFEKKEKTRKVEEQRHKCGRITAEHRQKNAKEMDRVSR